MRKIVLIVTCAALMFTQLPLMALVLALPECCNLSIWPPGTLSFYGAVGWRKDNFNWVVKNPSVPPNVISKLKWKELRMIQYTAGVRYICRNYVARFKGDYAHIYHGHNKDLDFFNFGNGNKFLFSKSSNRANKGYVYDLSPGVGYQLTSNGGRCIVTPMGGWSYHAQHLRIFKGHQRVNLLSPLNIGRFHGLNSIYKTRWYGGWVGIDFETKVECNAWLFGGFEYHWMRYRAKGDWNLRHDIKDFRHQATAAGYIANIGFDWECIPNFTIGFMGDYKFFRTSTGDEKTRIIDSEGKKRRVRGTLAKVHWHAISVSALLGYRF